MIGKVVVSILDVLDNFLVPSSMDIETAPGTAIHELGEQVRAFAGSERPGIDRHGDAVYLGGWPSANFWTIGGDLLLSSLLYSPQLLVRDPICDWFSQEQYWVRHKLSARPGYLTDGQPNIGATRAFLRNVIPQLERWRPLIESGVVVLTTAENHAFTHREEIAQLQARLEAKLLIDPVGYAEKFQAGEIAVEDNVRGYFTFAGGEQEVQLRKAQADGIYHFAREYVLATANGAVYTAPFRHERHLCRNGLAGIMAPSARVIDALLRSQLPIFSGLSPKLVSKIHDDDAFAAFRAQLHAVYQQLPVEETDDHIRDYLSDQERALLAPVIKEAEKSANRGPIGSLGVTLSENAFALTATLATGLIVGDPWAATGAGLAGSLLQESASGRRRTETNAQHVWNELAKHQRSAHDELRGVETNSTEPTKFWGIPDIPSDKVTIAAGELLIDHWPTPRSPELDQQSAPGRPRDYTNGVYRRCECGSGRKYKFCCQPLLIAKRP